MVKSYVDRKEFKFLENRKKFLLVALCVICLGVLFNVLRGVKLDIKFTGGAMLKYSYALDKSVFASDVSASDYMKLDKTKVAAVVKEVTEKDSTITIAQSATSEGGVKNTVTVSMSGKNTIAEDAGEQVAQKLTEQYPKVNFSLLESNSVDATTGGELLCVSRRSAVCRRVLRLSSLSFTIAGSSTSPLSSSASPSTTTSSPCC